MSFIGNEQMVRVERSDNAIDPSTGQPTEDGATTRTDFRGTFDPEGEIQRKLQYEGVDEEGRAEILTKEPLQPDDLVEYNGNTYEVVDVDVFNKVIPHTEAEVRLIDR